MHPDQFDLGPNQEQAFSEWEELVHIEMEQYDQADQHDWECDIDSMLEQFNEIK